MKNPYGIIAFFIPLFIFLMAALLHINSDPIPQPPEIKEDCKCIVGKTYIQTFISEDPFKKPDIDTIVIVAKKNGYVKFRYLNCKDTSNYTSAKEKHIINELKLYN